MSEAGDSSGASPDSEFIAGPFVTCCDQVHQLIETIVGLYLDTEDENGSEGIPDTDSQCPHKEVLPPLPPPEEDDESLKQAG